MTEHGVEYYMALPYTIVIRKDDEGDYVARVEELKGCTADGRTPEEALKSLAEVQGAWLEEAIEAGQAIPEPSVEAGLPSGKWVQRVPRSLHHKLSKMAKADGASLNHFVTTILAEAVGLQAGRTEPLPSAWEELVETAAEWQLTENSGTGERRLNLLKGLSRASVIQTTDKLSTASRAKRTHGKAEEPEYVQ